MTFAPTPEQDEALAMFATGESLVIEAGAGTGKTSTLKLLAESTHRRGQYLAFNKAIVDESKQKFPGTVRCNTAHSAAFRAMVRKPYVNMDRLRSQRMKSWDIAAYLGIRHGMNITTQEGTRRHLSEGKLAGLTMEAIRRFCQSADSEPTMRHVPYVRGLDYPPGTYENNREVAKALLPYMDKAWADLMRRDGTLTFTHDHYLKAWQLDNPRIDTDYILFDEAQDANPVMVAIVAAQQGRAQLVWVGDSQQQIYTFTGAVNALETVGAKQTAYLTQSFRFGPAVADVANRVLSQIESAKLRLKGHEPIPSTVGPVSEPDAILTRTNAEAVRNVLEAQSAGKRPHLVGGGTDIVAFAKAAQALMDGRKPEHADLGCFDTWNEVLEYVAQDEQGGDLRLSVNLIEEFTVPVILAALDNMVSEGDADVVVSTAHKSKGREWDSVKLGADFPEAEDDEDRRLLYVAVTRAKLRLDHSAVPAIERYEHATGGSVTHTDEERHAAHLRAIREETSFAAALDSNDRERADDCENPEHDFASCPRCIQRAREAEHQAEESGGSCSSAAVPDERPVDEDCPVGSFAIYKGRGTVYYVPEAFAVEQARSIYQRTGQRIVVLDRQGELVVEFAQ